MKRTWNALPGMRALRGMGLMRKWSATSHRHPVVGLDLGADALKAVEVARSGAQVQVRHMVRFSRTELHSPPETAPEVWVSLIRQLWEAHPELSREVVLGLPSHAVTLQRVTVERMDPVDLARILPFELGMADPTAPDADVFDFHVHDPTADPFALEVIVARANRATAVQYAHLARQAGLTLRALDVESIALQNAWNRSNPETGLGWVALADVGLRRTLLNLSLDGIPEVGLELPWGTERIVSDGDGGMSRARALAAELRGLEVNAPYEGPEAQIGALHLAGGGADFAAFAQALGVELGFPVLPVRPFAGLDLLPTATTEFGLEDTGAGWMLALGLGLHA